MNAKKVKNKAQIIASKRDSQIFYDAIINPKKPSKTLQKALDNYNQYHKQ